MLLSCISKKSWYTQSKLPREVTWKDLLVHVQRWVWPRCGEKWALLLDLPYSLQAKVSQESWGTDLTVTNTREKGQVRTDKWLEVWGREATPAFPETSGFWPGEADVNMDHTSYVLSLVGCTLWTLLKSFIPMMLQNKCHWVHHRQFTQNLGMSTEERSVAGLDNNSISILKGCLVQKALSNEWCPNYVRIPIPSDYATLYCKKML